MENIVFPNGSAPYGYQVIDGVSVTDNALVPNKTADRVLLMGQTDPRQNGIWLVSEENWSRALDFDGARDAVTGTQVYILEGSFASTTWYVTTPNPVLFGTSDITFAQVASFTSGQGFQYSFATTAALLSAFGATVLVPGNSTASTGGRDTPSDRGGGTFYYDAGDTTSADDGGAVRVDGQGRRWKLIVYKGDMDMAVYGLKYQTPTSMSGVWVGTDDLPAWNAAIAWAKIKKHFRLVCSGPTFVSSAIIISTLVAGAYSGYTSVSIAGTGKAFDDPSLCSAFYSNFTDKPVIVCQNGRCNTFEDFYIVGNGGASAAILSGGAGGTTDYSKCMDVTNYTSGLRDSRYSPDCGIGIDPFGTTLPADGGYPGLSAQYASGAAGSSGIIIRNVVADNFTVAFMISANGQTQNAENIALYDCYADFCKVGVGIGQSQSRNVNLFNFNGGFNYYSINTRDYGNQQGASPNVFGANLSGKYLFWCNCSFGSAPVITGIYAESFASIGSFGASASSSGQPLTISGMFSFSDWNVSGSEQSYPDFHFIAFCPVKFAGTAFVVSEMAQASPLRFFHQAQRGIDFDTCELPCVNDELALVFCNSGTLGIQWDDVTFRNCTVREGARGPAGGLSKLDSFRQIFGFANWLDGQYVAPGQITKFSASGNNDKVYFNTTTEDQQRASLGSVTVTVGANGTAQFTASDPTIIRKGDHILATDVLAWQGLASATGCNCIGNVNNISGSTVTLTGVPESLASGTYTLHAIWWERAHQASIGDVATTTSTLANVTNATSWKAGHKVKAVGVKTGSYATATGSGTSLTISSTPTATNAAQRLFGADLRYASLTAV
jgi:hypothetical protein